MANKPIAVKNLNNNCRTSIDTSIRKMSCIHSEYKPTKVRFNAVTKEFFDESDNFIGFGIYNESTKTLIVSAKH